MEKLTKLGKTEEAWRVAGVLMGNMEEGWLSVGLGRFILEDITDFILLSSPKQQANIAWRCF
jgi:hypothetical protein